MPSSLPPVDQVLRRPRMTYDQALAALQTAGYGTPRARNIAAVATGRSDGDVKRKSNR